MLVVAMNFLPFGASIARHSPRLPSGQPSSYGDLHLTLGATASLERSLS